MIKDPESIIARKMQQMFPEPERRVEAERLLALYGLEPHEAEIPRVRLAILKNAGADLDNMRYEVSLAKQDYRDAIVAAELSCEARDYLAWLES